MDEFQEKFDCLMNENEFELKEEKKKRERTFLSVAREMFPEGMENKQKLSPEERKKKSRELCLRIQNGDSEAKEELINLYINKVSYLVANRCGDYGLKKMDFADILQECVLELFELAKKYDPEKDAFSTYVSVSIDDTANKLCKKYKGYHLSLDQKDDKEEEKENYETVISSLSDEKTSAEVENYITENSIEEEVKNLPDAERAVMTMVLGIGMEEGMSIEEIAQMLGVDYDKIDTYYKRALKTLRERLGLKPAA